jgi:hypothetical protein
MLPALSQALLVKQTIAADALQPTFAAIPDGLSGVAAPAGLLGIAVVNAEKLGLLTTTHHVRWNEGVQVGEVTVEVADEVTYTGAWKSVAVVTFAGQAPYQDFVTVTGPHAAYRHRITTQVTGGSVSTKIVGSV